MSQIGKYRSYSFTINHYTDDDLADILVMSDIARYVIAGFEVGKDGTPHVQGYVYFDNARQRKAVSKMLPRAHIEASRKGIDANITYCSKDGAYYESGDRPTPGRAGKALIEDLMVNPYDNFHLFTQYRRAYRELQLSEIKTHDRLLYVIEFDRRFEVARNHDSVLFLQERLDTYNGEDVVFMMYDNDFNRQIEQWKHGYPPSIKRGFEIIKFDPRVVFIMTDGSHSKVLEMYKNLLSD